MWKRTTLALETIFDKNHDEIRAQERTWFFFGRPSFRKRILQETVRLPYLSSLSYREAERLLCVESLIFRFSPQN